ncbi:hypothetical protein U9M48_020115 [Paspalum notatum var. saurae]|uniref:NAD-dependent epimerase/dehydratase domain-containing protein n=1 Tax=Paspalum notatum var. saurae TaxID=547442 RepID=A0AAQ3TFD5_PASNO
MAQPAGEPQLVCVTGAGGFIGSWLVKELLLRGYRVRGTARNPEDWKNAHLRALDGAKERLSLCRADLLDFKSLADAFRSCDGVFHVASPIADNDPELMEAATEGTKNVINAAADMGVQRVVFTSSYGAVYMNPNRSPDQVVDESCWSDLEFCLQTKNFYCYAKTVAEKTAMEEASRRGIQLLVVVPPLTLGEMLQPMLHPSIYLLVVAYLLGTKKTYPNTVSGYVDVQDVARAHVLVYETPTADGRYLCIGQVVHRSEFIQMMRELFPQYPVTARCKDENAPKAKPYKFSTERLHDLGMTEFTPLKESLHKTVVSLQRQVATMAARPAGEQLVCVTGAGGFIGSSLVKELLQRGNRVRGTARNGPW